MRMMLRGDAILASRGEACFLCFALVLDEEMLGQRWTV